MPAGRPRMLTAEVLEDVRRLLPTVLYLETVADYIGVTRTAVRQWIKRGKQEEKRLGRRNAKPKESEAIYLEFLHTYKKSLAEGELYAVGVIKKASADQWQAAAWILERRWCDRWSSQRREIAQMQKELKELQKHVGGGADNAKEPAQAEG